MNGEDLSQMPVRELLHLSQTDVTPDPEEGLIYASLAWGRTGVPEVMAADPTAAGEAAAKAGFRATQAGRPLQEIEDWFTLSYASLSLEKPAYVRERSATHLLEARAFGLMAIKATAAADKAKFESRATKSFALGDLILRAQHVRRTPWDPYATMLDRHMATFESVRVNSDIKFAVATATQGIRRAILARQESANAPNMSRAAKIARHSKFVGKQVLMNAAALSLAITRPLDKLPKVASARRQLAIKLLS